MTTENSSPTGVKSAYPFAVIAEVNAIIDPRELLRALDYYPNKIHEKGITVHAFCPIHRESIFRTLIVERPSNHFRCTYALCEASTGGNLIELFARVRKLEFDEALHTIVKELSLRVRLPVDPAHVKKTLEVARNYLDLGAHDEAEKLFTELLGLDSELVEAHEGLLRVYNETKNAAGQAREREILANACSAAGDVQGAFVHIEALVGLNPESAKVKRLHAEGKARAGECDDAFWEFMAAADLFEATNDFEGALECYLGAESLDVDMDVLDLNPHIVGAFTQAGNPEKAVEYLATKAERAAEALDFARAADLLAQAIDLDTSRSDIRSRYIDVALLAGNVPDLSQRLNAIVDFFVNRGDSELALAAMRKFADLHPDDLGSLERLAFLCREQGQPAEAAVLDVRLARLQFDAGNGTGALAILQRVLDSASNNVAAIELSATIKKALGLEADSRSDYTRLAQTFFAKRDFERVTRILDELLRVEPEAMDLLDLQADTLEMRARFGESAVIPAARDALEGLGDRHTGETEGTRALRFYERAAALGFPGPELLGKLARTHLRMGNKAEARDNQILASESLWSFGEQDQAIAEAEQFLKLIPGETDLVRYLADLHVRKGGTAAALEKLTTLADAFAAEGNAREAMEVYERALTLQPDDITMLADLAEFQKGGIYDSKYPNTLMRLADVYEKQNDLESAIGVIEPLADHAEEGIAVCRRLIELHTKLGHAADARKWRLELAAQCRATAHLELESQALREALAIEPHDPELLRLILACEKSRQGPGGEDSAVLSLADEYEQKKDFNTAGELILEALSQNGDDVELNRRHFDLMRRAGKLEEAASRGLQLVNLLVTSGREPEALSVYEEVVACDSHNTTLLLSYADFLARTGRAEHAADRRFAVVTLYRERQQDDEAEILLNELTANDISAERARNELADMYESLGRIVQAEEQLGLLVEMYDEKGKPEETERTIRRILAINADSITARWRMIKFHRDRGAIADAVGAANELADFHRRNGRETEAIEAEREAVGASPTDTVARRRLVNALMRSGHPEQAAEELERSATEKIEEGDVQGALRMLDELLAIDPERLNARRMRAEAYSKLGDSEKALDEFRTLTAIAANHAALATPEAVPISRPNESALQLVKEYDFDSFVVGTANNFAYATALSVARAPARAYNPLFVYGDVGLGKTHLVNAIANYMIAQNADTRIIYTNSEDFTGELIDAIQNNAVNEFRTRYKAVDLFIVDDIQFLAGKQRAQEEFFHIFNTLFQAKRQIVVTSDRPPKDISHLENRLLSRLKSGVIVDVAAPDLETRMAILNREIEHEHLGIEPAISMLVAERMDTNIRELKGAMNQIVAMRDLRGEPVTEESVRKMLDSLYVRV